MRERIARWLSALHSVGMAARFGWVITICCMLGCSSSSDDGGGAAAPIDASCASPTNDVEARECEILALVNQVRAQGGTCDGQAMPAVAPLTMHPILRGAARAHAGDMAANDYFDHTSLDGRSAFERMQDAGYDFSTAGENISGGNATAQATMDGWMQSTGHCENILNPDFQDIGVGYAYSASNQLEHLWVQTFGAP